jgi:hypothetical protein
MPDNDKQQNDLDVSPKAVPPQGETVALGVRLLRTDKRRFTRIAKRRGLSAGTLGRVVILEWLKSQQDAA